MYSPYEILGLNGFQLELLVVVALLLLVVVELVVVLLVTTLLVTALDAGTELVPALLVPVLLVAEEPVEDVATPLELTAPEDATVPLEL